MNNKRIYLDHAATTYLDQRVFQAMRPYFLKKFGNPASIHSFGQEAQAAVDKAREKVAAFLRCKPEEIIFTSGATESNNLALKGIVKALKEKGNHIITSAIEHHSILEPCEVLEKEGIEITKLLPNKKGIIDPKDVEKAITKKTILISIMYANNEVGTIQPIPEIGKIAQKNNIIMHTDAVQAAAYLNCHVDKLKVDLLSLSGHKFYGPKGIGILYIRKGTPIKSIQQGGHQEYELRAGTLNVPGIVGIGEAIKLVAKDQKKANKRIERLRDKLINGILKLIPDAQLNGSLIQRLPNNANLCFKNTEGESMLINLDFEGIAVSTGSACSSKSLKPSHVLLAMGIPPELAHGSIRFTLGKSTTKADIDKVIKIMPKIVKKLRKMSPLK